MSLPLRLATVKKRAARLKLNSHATLEPKKETSSSVEASILLSPSLRTIEARLRS